MSRRHFLFGRKHEHVTPLRPPGSVADPEFTDVCTGCGDCVSACRERVIVLRDDSTPELAFQEGGCTFCGDCATVCDTGAIALSSAGELPLKATISRRCLAQTGVFCQSCADACLERAIRFDWTANGLPSPTINSQSCTGCGFCVSACPASAISVDEPRESSEQ